MQKDNKIGFKQKLSIYLKVFKVIRNGLQYKYFLRPFRGFTYGASTLRMIRVHLSSHLQDKVK